MSTRRDYKSKRGTRATKGAKRQARVNGLLIAVLLVIILFAGFLTYISQLGDTAGPATAVATTTGGSAAAAPENSQDLTGGPKYDFYQDLSRQQLEQLRASQQPATAASSAPAEPTANTTEPVAPPDEKPPPITLVSRTGGTESSSASTPGEDGADRAPVSGDYMVQAGSFVRVADADRRKAKLALLGFRARIESALVNEREVQRVRIGPLADAAAATTVRNSLKQNGIASFSVKIK